MPSIIDEFAFTLTQAPGVPGGPTADFTADPLSGDVIPLRVVFTDFSTGGPVEWLWDFGDGSSLNDVPSPVHFYESEGAFTVSLTVTDAAGLSDTLVALDLIKVDVDIIIPPPDPTGLFLDEVVVMPTGVNQIHALVVADGRLWAGTRGFRWLITFNDLADLTDFSRGVIMASLADPNVKGIEAMTAIPALRQIYLVMGVNRGHPLMVIQVLATGPGGSFMQYFDTTEAGASPGVANDGGFLYVVTNTNSNVPARIVKISAASMTKIDEIELISPGAETGRGHSIVYDGESLYATGLAGSGWIARIDPQSLAYEIKFDVVANADTIVTVGDWIWAGPEGFGDRVFRTSKDLLMTQPVIHGFANTQCHALSFDGSLVWLGISGPEIPGNTDSWIIAMDPNSLDVVFEAKLPQDFGHPEEIIVTLGRQVFAASFDSPARVARLHWTL